MAVPSRISARRKQDVGVCSAGLMTMGQPVGDGRRYLVHRQVEREVEGRDAHHHTDGKTPGGFPSGPRHFAADSIGITSP